MSITFEKDGSVTLRGDADPSRVRKIASGRTRAYIDAQAAAFHAEESPPVPAMVTNYQARAALLNAGLFDAADAAVKASGSAEAVQAWEFANNFYRSSPFVAGLGAGLNLSDARIDDLFRQAATID